MANFNYGEAILWFLIAAALWVHSRRNRNSKTKILRAASLTFLFFGGSDLVEAKTGAWWTPWWLFLWKAACVLLLLICCFKYRSQRSPKKAPVSIDSPPALPPTKS